ncbi:MAG: precorrin-6y C5,15-methyltransferase (decarboxylating) subunit CbiE [Paracoccaceae bacterium]
MAETWLSIIGLGEDGPEGLTGASRAALARAEVVFGGPRHLALVGAGARGQAWPVPFDLAPVLARRGQPVAVLASGDPFWFGAGGSLSRVLAPGEWRAYPAPSVFSLAAARLGWRLEEAACLGLHAAPLGALRPALQPGARIIATLRDGAAVVEAAHWLTAQGLGAARLWVLEALGGPGERILHGLAGSLDAAGIGPLVTLAIEAPAQGPFLPRTPGRPEALFAHDGQITKSPVRAVTLAALAPKAGELLWDLGAGSGSVSVEWCLAGGRAIAVEARADRLDNIRANIDGFGLAGRMQALPGTLPGAVEGLETPQAVFVGGGFSMALMERLALLRAGTRLVVNTVTLETEALVSACQRQYGGALLRMDFAQAEPLGASRGWQASRPVVQWSVVL